MLANNFTKVSFYIVAHADDWMLFMCPNVYNDIIAQDCKVVFIITTAGDAGMDEKFWLAREEGSKSSLRFCLAHAGDIFQLDDTRNFNEHSVYYWRAKNTASYFMRLPDGNLDATGFSSNNFQSLAKLKSGEINSVTATDNSTTYNSWLDFSSTIEKIIIDESEDISERWIHYLNPNTTLNPNDHADHIATGEAIQCMNVLKNMKQVLYAGYNSRNHKIKLNSIDLFWKAGMFAAYEKAVFDNCGYSTLKEDANLYVQWCLSSADFIIKKP